MNALTNPICKPKKTVVPVVLASAVATTLSAVALIFSKNMGAVCLSVTTVAAFFITAVLCLDNDRTK